MEYFCGIDIGSAAIKAVLVDEAEQLIGYRIAATGGNFYQKAVETLEGLVQATEIGDLKIAGLVSTGYGRKLLREADEAISEITANALGARQVAGNGAGIRTVINIGGQDSKIIVLDGDGRVLNFLMNDRCAAGTGRFLEMAAAKLEVALEELGAQHLSAAGAPVTLNSTCTVFAESEIISLLANGHGIKEIIAGVHHSIARRTARLARKVGIQGNVLFDGGPALNKGLVAALEQELKCELIVPAVPQITTALGAAVAAKRAC